MALADAELQKKIQASYPELWARIAARREYIRNVLHINIADEAIPLSNTVAYLRPFLLAKDKAFAVQ